jgi:hypothetical protein
MVVSGPSRRAGGSVISFPDRLERRDRQPARPGARRDAGAEPLVHWAAPYRPSDSASYDLAVSQVWRLCDAGIIDRPEAEARDVVLRRLRFALGEGREARP